MHAPPLLACIFNDTSKVVGHVLDRSVSIPSQLLLNCAKIQIRLDAFWILGKSKCVQMSLIKKKARVLNVLEDDE